MGLFGGDKEHDGRFKLDDDVRRALDDMTNTDEAVELLDMLADHQDTIEDAVTGLDALHRAGCFDLMKQLDPEQTTELDFSNRPTAIRNLATVITALNAAETQQQFEDPPQVGPFEALRQLRDPEVQRGLGRLIVLLRAIGRQPAEQ